ncbi:DUF2927 domain-containing protein [Litorisediminicola beolgyonensis]|uniref:DUF2927 domain-containing protein n=1 Tax=Litorisediminicola beolgyonensis TaxID=1173614 RepID=A0ABW3ZMV3_9RHOB
MRRYLLPLMLTLAACAPASPPDTPTRLAISDETTLPAMKAFSVPRPERPTVSNRDLARDVLDLAFSLESGRRLSVFTRFEGPIDVRVIGHAPRSLGTDLNRLIYRLQNEGRVPIRLTGSDQARVTIQAVPRATIRRHLPQAACFVVPSVRSLEEYAALGRRHQPSWTTLTTREHVTMVIPSDSTPQELRDCLHEELAQALGPLNDLYRLPDSVFNDDNVHTVLTGYDMLVMRVFYDPALRSGMSRAEVSRRLPAILARINPAGESLPSHALATTPRRWIEAVQEALGPGASPDRRRRAAMRALQVASAMGWQDHRRGFSHYAMGRVLLSEDPEEARRQFLKADAFFAATPGTALHRAYVGSQLAAYEISQNRPDRALMYLGPQLDVAARHENAALLATLMLLRAEALDMTGRVSEAREVRLDSLGWARYGFGPDWAVRTKLREIAALNPLKGV